MRRITIAVLLAVVAVVASATEAHAQFDLSRAISSFFGGSSDDESQSEAEEEAPSPYEVIASQAPSHSAALGTWVYQSVTLEYFGDNSFADVALAPLEGMGVAELEAAGITSGSSTLTLRRGGAGSVAYGEYLLEGRYRYTAESGALTITAELEGVDVSCPGYMTLVDGELTVLINADAALDAYLEAYPEQRNDQTIAMASSLLASFNDVYVAIHLRR